MVYFFYWVHCKVYTLGSLDGDRKRLAMYENTYMFVDCETIKPDSHRKIVQDYRSDR